MYRSLSDTTYVILRPRGLFGPHDRVIVPRLLQQLSRDRNVLRLPGGGQAQLDLTFVLNVVHAMMLATDNDGLRPVRFIILPIRSHNGW